MNDADLLLRIAQTLKEEIGPAIDAEYPKTQAFMAAVVLQKLGRELSLAPAHALAGAADIEALVVDLGAMSADVPAAIRDAVEHLARCRDAAALCRLVEALYASRAALGDRRFDELLARVRRTLGADIERRLEFAE
jgi:hypothetical protein